MTQPVTATPFTNPPVFIKRQTPHHTAQAPYTVPAAQDRLVRADRENLDLVAFRLLYVYVHEDRVFSIEEMVTRTGLSRTKVRAGQRILEEQDYIYRDRHIAGNIHFTALGLTRTAADDLVWGTVWDPYTDEELSDDFFDDPDGIIAEAEEVLLEASKNDSPTLCLCPTVINSPTTATNYASPLTNYAGTSATALSRDDKGRYISRSAKTPGAPRGALRLTTGRTAKGKYSYPSDTHSTTPLRGVASEVKNPPVTTKDQAMIRTQPSSDFESPMGSDFGDMGPSDFDHGEAPVRRQGRGKVYRVVTSRPTDRRHDKAPSAWTGGDLAAEFGSLVNRHCPDLFDATNFARVRGAICGKVKAGADPAELKMILEMFFADPRNLRAGGIPIWRRFLASLPNYQANAMLALGKLPLGPEPVPAMSATPTDETEAFNRATMARIRALRSAS